MGPWGAREVDCGRPGETHRAAALRQGTIMKKVLGAIAILAAMPLAAQAADLPPAPAPAYKAPVVVPEVYGWTGFYIGADAGWWNADQSATTTAFPAPGFGAPAVIGGGFPGFGNLPTSHTLNGNGGFGGGYAGFNWQPAPWALVGVEGDVQWLRRSASDTENVLETFTAVPAPSFGMTYTASNNWLASARGRLGWVGGPFMLYGTGGAAFTQTNYTATAAGVVNTACCNLPGATASSSFSNDRVGWVAGAGVEWMAAPNWIVRAEYLHYNFGGASANLPFVYTPNFAGVANCNPGQCNWALNSSNLTIDTVRVGLSYKFGGPVVARY